MPEDCIVCSQRVRPAEINAIVYEDGERRGIVHKRICRDQLSGGLYARLEPSHDETMHRFLVIERLRGLADMIERTPDDAVVGAHLRELHGVSTLRAAADLIQT